MNAIVETDALTKRYGPFTALVDCTLSVNSGEVFGLLGPNGAGKTTLLRLLLGFLRPTSGSASIAGLDCHHQCADVHKLVSYLPGDARLFRTMRGRQVLKFFSEIREDSDLERAQQIAERLELDLSRWVGFMSTGMRQKLALAVVMSVGARLLVLDEPTSNLDPNVRGEIIKMVVEAKQNGQTVILSSHVLSEVEETCDRVGILRAGHLVHTQCMNQLKRQHRITALTRKELPDIPLPLQDHLSIVRLDEGRVQIETPGELSMILHWLANAQLDDVYVEPIGLRSIYDQFHHDQSRGNFEECVTP